MYLALRLNDLFKLVLGLIKLLDFSKLEHDLDITLSPFKKFVYRNMCILYYTHIMFCKMSPILKVLILFTFLFPNFLHLPKLLKPPF